MSDDPTHPVETPLESWKAIAEYLQRDARTVRRWEALERLRVHRHRHLSRSSVYAYPSELGTWRATRRPLSDAPATGWLGSRGRALALASLVVLAAVSPGGGRVITPVRSLAAQDGGDVVRQIWTGPEVDLLGAPSLDGRYLSYVDWETGDLALRDLSTGEKQRLTSRPPGEFAFYSRISPDGRKVAYVWVDNENPYHLRVTSIDDVRNGVAPRVLYRNTPGYMDFGDWSPDGSHILANIRGIELISVADGGLTTLKTLPWGPRPKPRFSPDGRWIAYDFAPTQGSRERDVMPLGFTRSGAFHYGLSTGISDVYLAALDLQTGRVTQPPKPVSDCRTDAGRSTPREDPG